MIEIGKLKNTPKGPNEMPLGVKILSESINAVTIPVMGASGVPQVMTQIYGLGDDNKMYAWSGQIQKWVET